MTFYGNSRVDPERLHHAHESPPVDDDPADRARGAVGDRRMGRPARGFAVGQRVRALPRAGRSATFKPIARGQRSWRSQRVASGGLADRNRARLGYVHSTAGAADDARGQAAALYQLLLDKYYVDRALQSRLSLGRCSGSRLTCSGARSTRSRSTGWSTAAGLTVETGGELAPARETGNVQHYAFVYLLGALAIAAYYLYLVMR